MKYLIFVIAVSLFGAEPPVAQQAAPSPQLLTDAQRATYREIQLDAESADRAVAEAKLALMDAEKYQAAANVRIQTAIAALLKDAKCEGCQLVDIKLANQRQVAVIPRNEPQPGSPTPSTAPATSTTPKEKP